MTTKILIFNEKKEYLFRTKNETLKVNSGFRTRNIPTQPLAIGTKYGVNYT